MAKKQYIIQIKYPEQPWVEWARTIVPSMVDHYLRGAQVENPGAEIRYITLK